MTRIAVGVALIGVLVFSSASASKEAARAGVETQVSLELAYFPDIDRREYRATVSAEKSRCVDDRIVRFYEKLSGPDRLIGKDATEMGGHAFVHETPAPPFGSGEFYAKVKRREVGRVVCKPAKSAVGAGARSSSSAAAVDRAAPR